MQTFLFTDIQASTRLWNLAPVAMATAVQRQEALLRDAIEEVRGAIFKTVGDGVYAVFSQAPEAVQAAVEAQRALMREPWAGFEEVDDIRVRMGIHTGPADVRDGDYFGPTLNRLSRMLAAGHGGQILCTAETLAACGEEWPQGIGLRDLGERTLRDVPGSGRIFQLVVDGLPEHFPPLNTLDPRTHNLPQWASPMLGRDADAVRLRAALRGRAHRMVTVLGTGGVGKTRLATEVAAQLLDEQQDGIRFVDLSALREDAQVVPAVVQATGAADPLLAPGDALLEWLRDRELLLVLDNCEQVIEGVAELCSDIQQRAPGVTVLATSRVPVHIRGELQLALEPLPIPDDPTISPAVQLFAERAREVNERFRLNAGNAADVAGICRIVDGLPLAIELAAAWVRMLSPEALRRRLEESRSMLRDGARDLPDRQRTLASTIAWSYDLLAPEDQRAFRRLAVFRGGIAVDAATAVIRESPTTDPLWTLSRLNALVQANLLQVSPDATGEPRFLMLQTIQEFATEIVRMSGEWDDAAMAHAEYFAALATEAESHYRADDQVRWLHHLERELENFRAVVEHFAGSSQTSVLGLEMAIALWEFLDQWGHQEEARTWLDAMLENNVTVDDRLRARALLLLGNSWLSNAKQAETFYRRAGAAARAAQDPQLQRSIEGSIGLLALSRGDFERAIAIIETIVAAERASSDNARLANALAHLAQASWHAGRYNQALVFLNEADTLDLDPLGRAWNELIRGKVLRRSGAIDASLTVLEHARAAFGRAAAAQLEADCRYEMSAALLDRDSGAASAQVAMANALLRSHSDPYVAAAALDFNTLALAAGSAPKSAAILLAAANTWRGSTGNARPRHDQQVLDALATRLRAELGAARFQYAVAEGQTYSLRTAFSMALDATRHPSFEHRVSS